MSLLLFILVSILFSIPHFLFANPGITDHVRELTLPNGMKFLLVRRTGAPVFSAYIRVKVGGVDEVDGKTGVAHLLEHMAFKGTSEIGTNNYSKEKLILEEIETLYAQMKTASGSQETALKEKLNGLLQEARQYVVPEEFSRIYNRNGATNLNATTSQDLTTYFVSLPSNKLRLWAYLESSRLRDPVFRDFYAERDVVQEERRTRVEDSPFGKLYETFIQQAFEKSPYRRPTIGLASDIPGLTATDLREFYGKYYVPSNIVGTIVGDISLEETERILREYFGPLPSGEKPPLPRVEEPEPRAPKQAILWFDASPSFMAGYLKPTLPNRDDYIFDVLDQVLCEGSTSRLYRRLVEQDRLVQTLRCDGSTPGSRFSNLYFMYGSIIKGHTAEEVLRVIDEELEKIAGQGVTEAELAKAKKNLMAQWYYDMQSNEDLAELLSYFEVITGSWKYILEHPQQIQAVSGKDLQQVVQKYLKPERRRVALLKSRKPS